MIKILLIGAGYYARRTYVPTLSKNKSVKLAAIVDIELQKNTILNSLEKYGDEINYYFIKNPTKSKNVSKSLSTFLNKIVDINNINAVVISTPPESHLKYAKWALGKKLHILMDKPVSTENNIVNSISKSKKILSDYINLAEQYKETLLEYPNLVFNLMAQRRFHPVFIYIKNLINEVVEKTNCPVTSIQCSHSDGQWRFPAEIIEQDYHPYNTGYGKLSHSGYHFIDICSWLINSTIPANKSPDSFEVLSSSIYPIDVISQFTIEDYHKLFNNYKNVDKYTQVDFEKRTVKFGEVDNFSIINFIKNNKVISTCTLNLLHNGFSQRNWIDSKGRDLYKSNGRIKQEFYNITQGPFQSIIVETYQSREDHDFDIENQFSIGGKNHLELHVFRNSQLYPDWQAYSKQSLATISSKIKTGKTNGIQEESRVACIEEFISNIDENIPVEDQTSNFKDHYLGVAILSSIYQSINKKKTMGNNIIKTLI